MGSSKKHKKHKSERREKYEEYSNRMDPSHLQRGLKLILKVGPNNTPEYTSNSTSTGESISVNTTVIGPPTAAEAMCSSPIVLDDLEEPRTEKHKKSKKKKKKKDREKRHKHHKEKRRHKSERHSNIESVQISKGSVLDTENLSLVISQDSESTPGELNDQYVKKFNFTDAPLSNVDAESSQDVFSFVDDDNSQPMPENILFFDEMSVVDTPSCRPDTKSRKSHKGENLFVESPASSSHQSSSLGLMSAQSSRVICPSPAKTIPDLIVLSSSPSQAGSTPGGPSSNAELTPAPLEAPKTPSSSSESVPEQRNIFVVKLQQQNNPLNKLLEHLLRILEKRDLHQFFAWPVTDDYAPGYSRIITKPMDFSTMRQKIENNEYSTLAEFTEDFQLMCENAIKYNHVDTIYHKTAKRLLQIGLKQLAPEYLMRSLKPLSGYMRELTTKELGFELVQCIGAESSNVGDYEYQTIADSTDEGASTGTDETLTHSQIEDIKRRKTLRLENRPKTRFEPYVDDMTPEEILAQVQGAAKMAKERLSLKRKIPRSMGFLRRNEDGKTSLNLLMHEETHPSEKAINLGDLIGDFQKSTSQLHCYRDHKRNDVKSLKPLHYGPFTCFAPAFDSRFSTLNKEEMQLIMHTYGDAISAEYAESILQFTKNSNYATMMANSLLNVLTNGEHTKCMRDLYDLQIQNYEQKEALKCFNNLGPIIDTTASSETRAQIEQEYEKFKNIRIDFNRLRTLQNLGIDISFLDDIEKEMKNFELTRRLQEHLSNNLHLIDKLRNNQHERLSQSVQQNTVLLGAQSVHAENQLGNQMQTQNVAKKLTSSSTVDSHNLRKSMGLSLVDLPLPPQQHQQQQQCQSQQPSEISSVSTFIQTPITLPNIISNLNFSSSTSGPSATSTTTNVSGQNIEINVTAPNTIIHMDIDEDVPTTADGDLENELREFLESEPGLHAASSSNSDDNNLVAQLLMN